MTAESTIDMSLPYMDHNCTDDYDSVDWNSTLIEMRKDLGRFVAEIMTNYPTLCCRKVALNRSEEIDPSL